MTEILTGQAAVDELLALLDLRQVGADDFEGDSPSIGLQRVFGGQVAGQALVAAGRTVDPSRAVHSLHGYFVRPGDPTVPIRYRVENVRDGRSFSVRRSVAYQHDQPIFLMAASFHRHEEGLDHHDPPRLRTPPPEDVPTIMEWLSGYPERLGVWASIPRPIDVRYVNEPGWLPPGDRAPEQYQQVWMRFDGKLPDDPMLHACALTYASDLTLLDSVLSVHGEVWGPGGVVGASLDHAVWFHRPFVPRDWHRYEVTRLNNTDSRGLVTGALYDTGGVLIASTSQEALWRL